MRTEHSAFFDATSGEGASGATAACAPFRALKEKVRPRPSSISAPLQSSSPPLALTPSIPLPEQVGSLQYFVPSVGVAEDFSPTLFSTLEVQRLARHLLSLR